MKLYKIGISIAIICGIIGLLIAGYVMLNISNASEKVHVRLGVKEQSKTFLLANSSTSTFKSLAAENLTIVKTTYVIEIDNEIYVEPSNLDKIVNLISKNYTLFNKEKKNYDGYVTINDENDDFSISSIDEDGEKIGEYTRENSIELKNDKGKILYIRWTERPNYVAKENCIITPIVISDNYKPGATSRYTVDIVAVKLAIILDFYDNGTAYKYDAKNRMLYFIQ